MKKKETYNIHGEKWCNHCKKYQPVHEFGKNKQGKDGKDYRCIASRVRKVKVEFNPINLSLVSTINAPVLASQVLYKYQRPDFYDVHISKSITIF